MADLGDLAARPTHRRRHRGAPRAGRAGAGLVLPKLEVDGWQSRFGLGYQQSLFIGPGFTVMVGLVRALSLGLLSPLTAMKVTIVASFAAVPLGTAFVALSFGLGKRAAGIAAILSLTVSSQFGGAGLAGTFDIGLVPNQAASLFVLLSFGGMVRILRRPTTTRIVGTAFATATVIGTHPVATAILTVLALSLLIAATIEWVLTRPRQAMATFRWTLATGMDPEGYQASTLAVRAPAVLPRARARLGALAAAALLTGGLAAAQLVPLVAHRDLAGTSATWTDPDLRLRLLDMWHGEFLFRPLVFALVLLGFVFAIVVCRHRPLALTLVFTPCVFLLIGRAFITVAPDNGAAVQLTNRAFAYLGLLAVLPLATLLGWLTSALPRLAGSGDEQGAARFVEPAIAVLAGIAAVGIVLLPAHLNRELVGTVQPTPTFAHAADQIRTLVPDGARFATVRMPSDEPRLTGLTHPDFWIAWATGKDTFDIFNLESSSVADPLFAAEAINDADPNASDPALRADILSRLGVSHVLVINTAKATKVTGSARLKPVWQEQTMVIYEVVPPTGQPAPGTGLSASGTPLQATLRREGPEHLHFTATTGTATQATVALAWSPKWQATVNGRAVAVHRSTDGLVAVDLPSGESRLDLSYGNDGWDALGRLVSVATFILAITLLVRDRRGRRLAVGPGDGQGEDRAGGEREQVATSATATASAPVVPDLVPVARSASGENPAGDAPTAEQEPLSPGAP